MPTTNSTISRDKFWQSVNKSDTCWLWTKSESTHGYGQQWFENKLWRCHRLAWFFTHGPIPQGQCVCHRCDNPLCVRPGHLFLGTQRDNLRDMQAKKRNWAPPKGHQNGEKNRRSKLTESDVRSIRSEYADGKSLRVLGSKYGVLHTTIHDILTRRTWIHV